MKLANAFQKIECKRAIKTLPQYYLGVIILGTILGLVVLCGSLFSKEEESSELKVALVLNQNTFLSNFGTEVLQSASSVGSLCSFEIVEEATALGGIEDGTYCGAIIFPNHFIGSVLYGDGNEVASMYLPRFGATFNNGLFQGLASVASGMLSATESGMSAGVEVSRNFGADEQDRRRVESDIEALFQEHVFGREECFVQDVASGTGGVSAIQYYFCAALVLLLMLGGISCGAILKGDAKAFEDQLFRHRIGPVRLMGIRYVAVLLMFAILYTSVFALLAIAFWWKPELFYELFTIMRFSELLLWYVSGIPMLLLAAALVCLIYAFAGNQIGGILLLFLTTIVMGYASGCLAPAAYLPKAVRVVGGYLPTSHMLDSLLLGLQQMPSLGNLLLLLCMTIGALLLTAAMQVLRRRAGR